MSVPKIRYDWYQTETHVIVTILLKNAENVKIIYEENTSFIVLGLINSYNVYLATFAEINLSDCLNSENGSQRFIRHTSHSSTYKLKLSVSAKLPSGNDYSLELDLAHLIIAEQCSHKVLPSKIEIKLKKRNGIRWHTLEGNLVEQNVIQPIPSEILQANDRTPKYPSSCKTFRDWNKVEKEIEKQEAQEEPEGEAAVNTLLQRIYGNGSDEVRRAMNKSFVESGGTVLSTNWSEVGQGKVERKPPDGMEWKTWNS